MAEPHEELLQIADRLALLAERGNESAVSEPLDALHQAITKIGKAFSGSWLGYHAFVYYRDLEPPPPGHHFTMEWGLISTSGSRLGSRGDWVEFDPDDVKTAIYRAAGDPDLGPIRKLSAETRPAFERDKSEVLSIISSELSTSEDAFLESLRTEVDELNILSQSEIANRLAPSRTIMSRDSAAISQGYKTPPHVGVLAEYIELHNSTALLNELSKLARKAGSHMTRKRRHEYRSGIIGTNVFIGHGRSMIWKDLKDFVKDRLALPFDEFNRVPVAGITNTARLSEMMDAASIAFIILTGEDEQADGSLNARMNAVHEAGLFQGRLGFTKSIVLLEEGCAEFSNIQGLGQIRFPKGNIKAAFEDVRLVLEREGVISAE
jgi:Predicted nucleotide-binding protein containing TIR-like domain